jgi:hypothetical protein
VRLGWSFVLLAACGRIDFDPLGGAAGGDGGGGTGAFTADPGAGNSCTACSSLPLGPFIVPTGGALIAMLDTCGPNDGGCSTPVLSDPTATAWDGPHYAATTNGGLYLWVACGVAPSMTYSFSFDNSTSTYPMLGSTFTLTGAAAMGCLDGFGTASGTGAAVSVTTSTAVQHSSEFVLALFGDKTTASASMYTAGPGYYRYSVVTNGPDAEVSEYGLVTTGLSGPQTATATKSDTTDTWHALIATFAPP